MANDDPPKPRRRRKKDRRMGSTYIVVMIMAAFIIPTITGFSGMALIYGQRWISDQGPECVFLRVIDGGTVWLHCREDGIVDAELIGIEPPRMFDPKCMGELVDAYQARWEFQLQIWQARELRMVFDDPGPGGVLRMRMYLDDADIAKWLVYHRHSRQDTFGRRIDRCGHVFGD